MISFLSLVAKLNVFEGVKCPHFIGDSGGIPIGDACDSVVRYCSSWAILHSITQFSP